MANPLPCHEDTEHNNSCPSTLIIEGHRSALRASTTSHNKDEFELYGETVSCCYVHHFKKNLDLELSRLNVRMDAKIFFKNIASKSGTRSNLLERCLAHVKTFNLAFKLNLIDNDKVFIDFCISVTSYSDNMILGKVLSNYCIHYFLIF